MEYNVKANIKLFIIVAIYIILGILGVYSNALLFLFPLFNIPMIVYLMECKTNIAKYVLIHTIIIIGILVTTGSIISSLLYIIFIVLPAHIIVGCYHKDIELPYTVMYTGIIVTGVFYCYILGLKYLGVDYIEAYMSILTQYPEVMASQMAQLAEAGAALSPERIAQMKMVFEAQSMVIKYVYPALLMITGLSVTVVNIVLLTAIGKIKKWPMQSLRQLGQFKFSRKMVFLLILGILVTASEAGAVSLMGLNLVFFVTAILQMLGLIVFVVLIKRSRAGRPFKIMTIVLSMLFFYLSPTVMMVVGIADTMFNFRKVKIIV